MTQDEIIDMAKQSGFFVKDREAYSPSIQEDHEITPFLRTFAILVAAKEQKKWQDQTAVEIHEAVLEERERIHKAKAQPDQEPVAIGDIRALKHRIHELEGEVIGYKRILDAEQEPVAWEQFYPDIGKPLIEQPKVRTGDCLLVGVCASEGHKIQVKQEQEEYLSKAYRLANELRCHLATAPAPQRTWVGLTDKEMMDAIYVDDTPMERGRRVEAKLKDKNS